MAISQIITLPETAAVAGVTTFYEALGGDGYSAPHSAVYVTMEQAGDVSGGVVSQRINVDTRFVSVVDYVTENIEDLGATQGCALSLLNSANQTFIDVHQVVDHSTAQAQPGPGNVRYPPVFLLTQTNQGIAPRVQWVTDNVNGDDYTFKAKILQYHREALHRTPYTVFAANLSPRS